MNLHQQTFSTTSSEPADSNKSCFRLPVFWANRSKKNSAGKKPCIAFISRLFHHYCCKFKHNQTESENTLRREWKQKGAALWPTCALVLQALAVVALLADTVILSRVCATLAARHHVAAVSARFTQRGASGRVVLDVVPSGQVWGRRTARGTDVNTWLHSLYRENPSSTDTVSGLTHGSENCVNDWTLMCFPQLRCIRTSVNRIRSTFITKTSKIKLPKTASRSH